MTPPRPHPFTMVFGDLAAERFPAIRAALAGDLRLVHFLMTPAAIELLHELRPEEGLDEATDDFIAFVHAAFCYWHDGERTVVLEEATTRRMMEISDRRSESGEGAMSAAPVSDLRSLISRYVQIAPRLLWSQVESSEIHEPIDGWFAVPEGEQLRVVACLGVHSERPGLSVLTVVGQPPSSVSRDDSTSAFAPTMDGGVEAGLHSVANGEELLWLAWRASADRIG